MHEERLDDEFMGQQSDIENMLVALEAMKETLSAYCEYTKELHRKINELLERVEKLEGK